MRLLLVEGDAPVRFLIDSTASRRGHHVIAAPSVFEAMALLLDFPEPPDTALLDLMLSGMGGLAYADRLERQFPAIRLVFMTGWLHNPDMPSAERRGRLLPKPFTMEQLFDVLDQPDRSPALVPKLGSPLVRPGHLVHP